MKTIIVALAVLAAAFTATAQETNGSFFSAAMTYFSSFNTNYNWTSQRGTLEAGVDSISKTTAHLQNSLRLSYDVWKNFDAEVTVRDSGVAGTWCSAAAGIGYSAKLYDAKLTLSAQGGRDFVDERAFGEVSLQASKKMTRYSHAFIRLGARLPNGSQILAAGIGFSF